MTALFISSPLERVQTQTGNAVSSVHGFTCTAAGNMTRALHSNVRIIEKVKPEGHNMPRLANRSQRISLTREIRWAATVNTEALSKLEKHTPIHRIRALARRSVLDSTGRQDVTEIHEMGR